MFGPFRPLLFVFILLPLLLVLLHVQAVSLAFANLGLTPALVIVIFYLSLLGSFVNIPVSRRRIRVERKSWLSLPFPLFFYPPRVREQVLAVNVGGAVVPVLLALYVLPNAPLPKVLLATAAVSAVCFAIARPKKGVGITIPALIPPVVAALLAYLLVSDPAGRTAVAYISGAMGTLIGADILNLPRIHRLGAHVVSIGGAGVFDGIFLVGILAAILT